MYCFIFDEDLDVLSSVSSVLRPLCRMTDLLSGEQYDTFFVVKPLYNHILSKVLLENEEDTTLSKKMKIRMKEKLNSYYAEESVTQLFGVCSFLDP